MSLYTLTWVNADGIAVSRIMEFKSVVAATLWLANNATRMVGATVLPAKGAGEVADKLQVWAPESQRKP